MEKLSNIIPNQQQMRTNSQNRQNGTRTIPIEQHTALFSIINQARLIRGWGVATVQVLNEQITVWAKVLDRYQIPFDAYEELLNRAIDTRTARLNQGLEMPDFSAELLVAGWQGENGLQKERFKQKADLEKAILPEYFEPFDEDFFKQKVAEGAEKMRMRLGVEK